MAICQSAAVYSGPTDAMINVLMFDAAMAIMLKGLACYQA